MNFLSRFHRCNAALFLLWMLLSPAEAGPGAQDATFGTGGSADLPFPPAFRSLESLAVQSDGKIVGAGPALGVSSSIGVVRWLPGGAVDSTGFGTGGITTLALTPVEKVRLALAPDGKITVLANRQINATTYEILVWRFLSTGVPDPGFGTAGQFLFQPPAGKSDLARCVMVQADGKTVIGGGSQDGLFLLRLGSAGTPDNSFGTNGVVRVPTPNQAYQITALVQQPDGAIVGCGWQKDGSVARNPLLLRLLPSGVADATFGSNGFRVLFALGELSALTLRGDGAIVAAGAYQGDALLSVLRRSGTRDLLFAPDNDGRTFNLGGTETINAVTVQSNGRIVISGSSLTGSNLSAVSAGITSTGVFDTNFGNGGANYHNFLQEFNAASQTRVETTASLPDGRLLAGGVLFGFGYSGAVLHRLEADATLHPIESWRIANFGSRINSGAGADAADPDLDGVPNLAEYAFNQNPNNRLSRTIPVPAVQGSNFVLAFPDPDAARTKKVSFRAEASAFLTPGTWQQISDLDTTGAYFFGISMSTNPKAFMRLQVDLQP